MSTERVKTYFGGMTRAVLSAQLHHLNVISVFGINPKVSNKLAHFDLKRHTESHSYLQVLNLIWRFVRKILSMKLEPNFSACTRIKVTRILYGAKLNRLWVKWVDKPNFLLKQILILISWPFLFTVLPRWSSIPWQNINWEWFEVECQRRSDFPLDVS